jgi:hypothetical protein
MAFTLQEVAVWTTPRGVPQRLVWNGIRYRVTDTPTRLEPDYSALTHPPPSLDGWRFQGSDDSGTTLVFDVRLDVDSRVWRLIRVYE